MHHACCVEQTKTPARPALLIFDVCFTALLAVQILHRPGQVLTVSQRTFAGPRDNPFDHCSLDVQVAGSVYIPEVNYVMMILTVVVIAIFKTTVQLGNAYGKRQHVLQQNLEGVQLL